MRRTVSINKEGNLAYSSKQTLRNAWIRGESWSRGDPPIWKGLYPDKTSCAYARKIQYFWEKTQEEEEGSFPRK
ncbi:hypothetical protein DRN46_05225 [Thermococci archaeon]|nr:MAG: hypothetical protein DRN46_05225 [Thermococci archaeon]